MVAPSADPRGSASVFVRAVSFLLLRDRVPPVRVLLPRACARDLRTVPVLKEPRVGLPLSRAASPPGFSVLLMITEATLFRTPPLSSAPVSTSTKLTSTSSVAVHRKCAKRFPADRTHDYGDVQQIRQPPFASFLRSGRKKLQALTIQQLCCSSRVYFTLRTQICQAVWLSLPQIEKAPLLHTPPGAAHWLAAVCPGTKTVLPSAS